MAGSNFIENELFDKGTPVKRCCRCGQRKAHDCFGTQVKRRRLKVRSECKECNNARLNEARAKDPGRFKAYNRKSRLSRYGLTEDEHRSKLESQGRVCAICKSPETTPSRVRGSRELSIDHNHATGVTRGLLCATCNLAIGYFKDDPALLRAAADYLEEHSASRPDDQS